MAAFLLHSNTVFKKISGKVFTEAIGSVRSYQPKKKPLTLEERRKFRFRRKPHDIDPLCGMTVKAGEVIYNQRTLRYCPGLNVGIGIIAKLHAKVTGKVVVTYEKSNLDGGNRLVAAEYSNNLPVYVKYVHVIPEPQPQRFKLVESF